MADILNLDAVQTAIDSVSSEFDNIQRDLDDGIKALEEVQKAVDNLDVEDTSDDDFNRGFDAGLKEGKPGAED